ncbi:MAG: alpha/beta hydrolase fold domain-containing protein [Caldilineaceae bacterium]
MPTAPTIIRLYDGAAPGSERWRQQEQENFSQPWQTQVVFNVTDPTLTLVAPDPAVANGTAIVICPGGGFHALSINSEGFDVARWLAARGVTCFVLKYRLVECKTDDPATEASTKGPQLGVDAAPIIPLAMADGLAAMRYVRTHAADYGIDPNRIGIIGFSAGGTVAASVAYNYTAASRPDFVAPIYLQYEWTIKDRVPADAPPLFVLAATDDQIGLAPHSVEMYKDWVAAGKSAELHLYATGGHGFGMRTQNLPTDRWIELFGDWLGGQGLMGKPTPPANAIGAEQARRLEAVYAQLVQLLAAPAGAQSAVDAPADTEWSATEVLGHMVEMIPYWLDVCQTILKADSPPTFGRSLEAPERLAGVELGANGSSQTLLPLLHHEIEQAAATISNLSDTARAKTGLHATRGTMTVAEIVEMLIVTHAESHLAQIQTILAG